MAGSCTEAEDHNTEGGSRQQQIPQWGASRVLLPRVANLVPIDQQACNKVIDLRCQKECGHKVTLQTPQGIEVAHPIALVVQPVLVVQSAGKMDAQNEKYEDEPIIEDEDTPVEDASIEGIVLEEAIKLLEEVGMVPPPSSASLEVEGEDIT